MSAMVPYNFGSTVNSSIGGDSFGGLPRPIEVHESGNKVEVTPVQEEGPGYILGKALRSLCSSIAKHVPSFSAFQLQGVSAAEIRESTINRMIAGAKQACTFTLLGSCQLPRNYYKQSEYSNQIWASPSQGEAIVADEYHGLQRVDVKNPKAPSVVGNWTGGKYWSAWGIDSLRNIFYSGFGPNGLQLLNWEKPSSPEMVGYYNSSSFGANALKVLGGNTFTLAFGGGFTILDTSNPKAPVLEGAFFTYNRYKPSFDVFGYFAFIGDYLVGQDQNALAIVSIQDKKKPSLVEYFPTSGSIMGVEAMGNTVFLIVNGSQNEKAGLLCLDVFNPSEPTLEGICLLSYAQGFAIFDNYAFVLATANDSSRIMQLFAIDISEPSNPTIKGSYNLPDNRSIWDVEVSDGKVYVTDEKNKFYVLSVDCTS